MHPSSQDPYRLRPDLIEQPPTGLVAIFRRIGPGLILASMIVGSGELIAATVLGAENGYALLWLVLTSCVIKVVVQGEFGRYTVATGETSLEALDRVPGPRVGVSWIVWFWFVAMITTMFGIGAMMGAIAEVLSIVFTGLPIPVGVCVVGAVTLVLLFTGRYAMVEHVSMGLVAAFTVTTVGSALLLLTRPDYFSWGRVVEGLSFHMPEQGLITAVAVFGITGIGANEIITYPYWCLEKGYARFTGPRDDTPAWRSRAHGWINVMGVDVLNSMVIYTFATIAFYMLGAGVLHGLGVIPQGTEMVRMLANMYTETLGGWSRYLFLAGAVVVFYSTVFTVTASNSRMAADFLVMLGLYGREDYERRLKWTRVFVLLFLLVPILFFALLREPVVMVKIVGVSQALLLPVVSLATIYLRYVHLPRAIVPKGWITLALWVTSLVIVVIMGYSVVLQMGSWVG